MALSPRHCAAGLAGSLLRGRPRFRTPRRNRKARSCGRGKRRGHDSSRQSVHTTYLSSPVPTSLWIIHPFHPLFGQEVTVLRPIKSPAGLAFRVRYPDGSATNLLREWTATAPPPSVPTQQPQCPLTTAVLREVALRVAVSKSQAPAMEKGSTSPSSSRARSKKARQQGTQTPTSGGKGSGVPQRKRRQRKVEGGQRAADSKVTVGHDEERTKQ